jgi:3-hydroxyacyl-CoA dehydrogenase
MSLDSAHNPWFPALPAGTAPAKPLRAIGIIGVGKTSTGLAHWCATKGLGVMLHDTQAGILTQGVEIVRALFKAAEERNEISGAAAHRAMGGISITTGLEDLEFCDIIIETLTEDMTAKQARLAKLAQILPADALLATSASATSVEGIGQGITGPDRVIGLQFFDPVHESRQVHVTLGSATSRLTAERVLGLIEALGKQPVIQRPARPGA